MPTRPQKKHERDAFGPDMDLKFSVAGMSYHLTPDAQWRLHNEVPIGVTLVREPDNRHDENAISIRLDRWRPGMMIGYVPRDIAAKLAPMIDTGKIRFSACWLTEVDPATAGGSLVVSFRKKLS